MSLDLSPLILVSFDAIYTLLASLLSDGFKDPVYLSDTQQLNSP